MNAYMAITGVSKPDATETECMTELFRKQLSLCADACKNGFKYVESLWFAPSETVGSVSCRSRL